MKFVYFDTNPLVTWSESKSSTPSSQQVSVGQRVEDLINNPDVMTALSETTLIELTNVMCKQLRSNDAPYQDHDESWYISVRGMFMRWVRQSDLRVLPSPSKLAERAMQLVEMATRDFGRNFRSWDAAHLHQASEWARELGQKVEIVTADRNFDNFLELYPEFAATVSLLDLT